MVCSCNVVVLVGLDALPCVVLVKVLFERSGELLYDGLFCWDLVMAYDDSLILDIRHLFVPRVVSDLLNSKTFLGICVQDVFKNIGSIFTHKFRNLIVST